MRLKVQDAHKFLKGSIFLIAKWSSIQGEENESFINGGWSNGVNN